MEKEEGEKGENIYYKITSWKIIIMIKIRNKTVN